MLLIFSTDPELTLRRLIPAISRLQHAPMSTSRISFFLCLVLTAGCAKEPEASEALESVSTPTSDEPYVETTHSLVLDTLSENLAVAYEAGLAACRNLSSEEGSQCHVTTASISTGDWPSASFQMRVTPDGIDAIVNAVEEHGQVVRRTTTSLDLAKPIVDQAQRIAMLEKYLADLEVLRQNAVNDVDDQGCEGDVCDTIDPGVRTRNARAPHDSSAAGQTGDPDFRRRQPFLLVPNWPCFRGHGRRHFLQRGGVHQRRDLRSALADLLHARPAFWAVGLEALMLRRRDCGTAHVGWLVG